MALGAQARHAATRTSLLTWSPVHAVGAQWCRDASQRPGDHATASGKSGVSVPVRCGSHALVWCRWRRALCGCRLPMPLRMHCAGPCNHPFPMDLGCHVSHWWAARVLCCCSRPHLRARPPGEACGCRAQRRVLWNPLWSLRQKTVTQSTRITPMCPPRWCASAVGAKSRAGSWHRLLCCSCVALCCRLVPWLWIPAGHGGSHALAASRHELCVYSSLRG